MRAATTALVNYLFQSTPLHEGRPAKLGAPKRTVEVPIHAPA